MAIRDRVFRVLLASLVSAGFFVVQMPGTAEAQRIVPITVTPSSGLPANQPSAVQVSSVSPGQWPANTNLSVVQCAQLSVQGCDNATTASTTTDGSGSFATSFTVRPVINPATGQKDCRSGGCTVLVADSTSPTVVGYVAIAFGSAAPTPTPPPAFEPGPGDQGPGGETLGPSTGGVEPACPAETWRIVFSRQENGNEHLWIASSDGKNARRLTTGDGNDSAPAVSPDGSGIAYVSDRTGHDEIWLLDVASGAKPQPLTKDSRSAGNPSWSPEGDRIVFDRSMERNSRELWVVGADGSDLRQLTDTTSDASFAPSWGPAGTDLIAFTSWVVETERANHDEIFLVGADAPDLTKVPGPGVTQLTSTSADGDYDRAPSWSPDGVKVTYHGKRAENVHVFVARADGADDPYQLTSEQGKQLYPAYSPDGTQIVYEHDSDGDGDLWVMADDGTGAASISTLPPPLDAPPFGGSKAETKRALADLARGASVEELAGIARTMQLKIPAGANRATLQNLIWRAIDPFDANPDWSACIGDALLAPKEPGASTPPPEQPTTTTATTLPPPPKPDFGDCVPGLEFGIADVDQPSTAGGPACLREKLSSGVYETTERILLNGIGFQPTGGSTIKIDPKARRIWSDGQVFTVLGDAVLPVGFALNWTLPASGEWTPPEQLSAAGAKLFGGLDLLATFKPKMTKGESSLAINVDVPDPLPDGTLTLAADNTKKLHVNDARITIKNVNVAPLSVKTLTLSYVETDNTFEASAKVSFFNHQVDGYVKFVANGAGGKPTLAAITAAYTAPDPGLLVGTGVYLTSGTFRYEALPITRFVAEKVTVRIGPGWRGFPSVFTVVGNAEVSSKELRIGGVASVVDRQVGSASLVYEYNRYAQLKGSVHIQVSNSYADFSAEILYQALDHWGASADVTVHLDESIWGFRIGPTDVGGSAVVSSTGAAVCGSIGVVSGGAGFDWGGRTDVWIQWGGGACSKPEFTNRKVVVSSFQAGTASGTPIRVGPDLPYEVFRIGWQGDVPRVELSGPGGRRIEGLADPSGHVIDEASGFAIFNDAAEKTTYILVREPDAGRWTIGTKAGSPPIAAIASADGVPAPQVTATVTGRGATRVLAYEVREIAGQEVLFVERGDDSYAVLGTATGAKGRLRFTPSPGSAGDRTITAEVLQDGGLRSTIDLTTYAAPATPVLRAPKAVKATRSAASVKVTWRRVSGAKRYWVVAKVSDGRRIDRITKVTSVRLPNIRRSEVVKITVRGLTKLGQSGAPAKVQSARSRR